MLQRDEIVPVLHRALEALPCVDAAFLAGSEAFGRQDRYSDIDFNCIASQKDAGRIFAAAEAALESLSPIALKLEMPANAAWPGLSQRFYRLRDTDEFLMIDFCQLSHELAPTFLEPVRHGTPVVLFDRKQCLKPVPLNRADHAVLVARRLAWLRASFPMFQNLVRKAVLRGDDVEATAMWMGQTLRPLVDLLRIRHNPERFDYGLRYTGYDLPQSARLELNALLWPRDGQDLLRKLDAASALFKRTLAELEKS